MYTYRFLSYYLGTEDREIHSQTMLATKSNERTNNRKYKQHELIITIKRYDHEEVISNTHQSHSGAAGTNRSTEKTSRSLAREEVIQTNTYPGYRF